jgi:peptidoglycan/LPS O-acetylase OafA/YrhL
VERGYRPELDGLRALAASAVVLFHAYVPIAPGGIRGVDVFFVLSGYLITNLLLTGERSVGAFWVARLRRLVPALALFLAAYVALAPLLLPDFAQTRWADAAFSALYVSDEATAFGVQKGLGHTWSLAVEMQFYLIWPFAVSRLKRLPPARAALLLWLAWVTVTAARGVYFAQTGDWTTTYYPSYLHCSGLLLGSALAFAPLPARWGKIAAAVLFALVLALPSDGRGHLLWTIPLTEVASAALVCALGAPGPLREALSWPPLVKLGVLSYGVYLWHHPLTEIFNPFGWWVSAPLSLALAIALSWLSFVTVEAWFRRSASRPALATT